MAQQHRAIGLQHRAPVRFERLRTLQHDGADGMGQFGGAMLDRLIGPGHRRHRRRLGDQPAAPQ
ncbi:hypothetical protein D3C87_1389870 [compost metagenome]